MYRAFDVSRLVLTITSTTSIPTIATIVISTIGSSSWWELSWANLLCDLICPRPNIIIVMIIVVLIIIINSSSSSSSNNMNDSNANSSSSSNS